MNNSTIALITTGSIVTAGLGYILYFDYKRRNDPTFRKQLKKERKQAAKASKKAEEKPKESRLQFFEKVIVECAKETYPTSPEEKEKYFMEQVTAGETLAAQGKKKKKKKKKKQKTVN
ncbi:hypothetical protein G6F56_006182 [Rhizopus delemar]|nr:hypothetical protein G6F56_006182 [Rhizopus delemar]